MPLNKIRDYILENPDEKAESRIFPFGIDYNVNSYFINELAKARHGKCKR